MAALLAASVYWMLAAWVPPGWALFAGLQVAIALAAGHYWMYSYWGGALTASGAALLLGVYGRIRRSRELCRGPVVGLALGITLITRPFEGTGLAVGVATGIILLVITNRVSLRRWALFTGGAVALLAIFGTWQLIYNARVTGDAFTLPYALHVRRFAVAPLVWFLPLTSGKQYPNPRVAQLHRDSELRPYKKVKSTGPVGHLFNRASVFLFLATYKWLGPAVLAFLLYCVRRHDRAVLEITVVGCIAAIPNYLATDYYEHYSAALLMVLFVACMRMLWRVGQWRRSAAGIILFGWLLYIPIKSYADPTYRVNWWQPPDGDKFTRARARVLEHVRHVGYKHVILVRYAPGKRNWQWVYNLADIDNSPVIWAVDLGSRNTEVEKYYPDRFLWRVDASDGRGELILLRRPIS